MLDSRSEFVLRDPSALQALLLQDWRARALLTDEDMIGRAIDRPLTTAVLRHLQRLGYVRALHGVRNQGGRMRVWALDQALRIQIVLDLRAATGEKLSACVDALESLGEAFEVLLQAWRSHFGREPDVRALQVHEAPGEVLLNSPPRLARFAEASLAAFVARNRFDDAPKPAFLL
ncbi:MAG: hypothetical protein NXI12_11825 [Alphaproteobacteria bacterium]|nr:hypothetical protein [Alphaproteobacteria bacterium]